MGVMGQNILLYIVEKSKESKHMTPISKTSPKYILKAFPNL